MVEVSRGDPIWALGLMSGTSMDGVDAAVILTDGETVELFGPSESVAFTDAQSDAIRRAVDWAAANWPNHHKLREKVDLWDIEEIREAEAHLHDAHVDAVMTVKTAFFDPFSDRADDIQWKWIGRIFDNVETISLVGFHGQTILHRPQAAYTLQIGDAALLAQNDWVDRPVVWDFRSEDMRAGGEGAPLAPFYHFALARRAGLGEPVAFLNLGGVGNVTWIDPAAEVPEAPGALLAFDTGPANALIDDFMAARTGTGYDADGTAAARGGVDRTVLEGLPEFPYLDRTPPKSLDRNDFLPVLDAVAGLSTEDGAATLTAFTADCVAASLRHMPSPPARWLVCGGGRRNLTLMRMLSESLGAPVDPVEAVGLDGDMLEAQAFAYLAVRVLRGLPTSAPSTTGCREPVCGGRIGYP